MVTERENRKSVLYSQNFVFNPSLVAGLVQQSSLSKQDIVYEMGPGTGIITAALARTCKKVIAVEIDGALVRKLKARFGNVPNVEIHHGDFLAYRIRESAYKVFSNIPFRSTSAIVKKLTESKNPPQDSFLFIQYEAAKKFMGAPMAKETQVSLLLKPSFELSLLRSFRKTDFKPVPNVHIVFLRIKKKVQPAVQTKDMQLYRDFVIYGFNSVKPNLQDGLKRVFSHGQYARLAA